jgi:hypothetical protein
MPHKPSRQNILTGQRCKVLPTIVNQKHPLDIGPPQR